MNRIKQNNGLFLIGVPRSGTTLLRLLLDAHSKIAIPFESFVLIDFANRVGTDYLIDKIEDRRRLVLDLLNSKGIKRWNPKVVLDDIDLQRCSDYKAVISEIFGAYARKCGKEIWGDKTPSYIENLDILNRLFPKAKFIHIIRDGRDVALSLSNQPWGPKTLLSSLYYWREIITWSRKMGRMLSDDRYLEIRFEDLVSETEKTIRKIINFIGLDYENSMLEQYLSTADTKIPSASRKYHINIGRPIDKQLAFKWKRVLSSVDQALCYEIAGTLLEELGYPIGIKEVPSIKRNIRKIYWNVRDSIMWRLPHLKRRLRFRDRKV